MAWEAPSPALVAGFEACLPARPEVQRRRMFGCPCAFVGGNMFAGVHEHRLILRLPAQRRAALIADESAQPFVVMGRSMREYVALAEACAADREQLAALLAEALAYASGLPAKESKPRRSKPAARHA